MSNSLNFDNVNKYLIYRYIRGSQAQGTATENSDIDEGGVYLCPVHQLLDLGYDYQTQIANETNDIVFYEFNKYVRLLLSANPTVLESLFVDDKYVLYETDIMRTLKEHRDLFITKKCFKTFISYAYNQIKKARGLNKKIVQTPVEKRDILSFCYTFYKQGSSKIKNWLEYRNLDQRYCGLVKVANMPDMYSVFYDFGAFFKDKHISKDDIIKAFFDKTEYDTIRIVKDIKNAEKESPHALRLTFLKDELHNAQMKNMLSLICTNVLGIEFSEHFSTGQALIDFYNSQKVLGYKGITSDEKECFDVRLSSVEKGQKPICYLSFSKDAFAKHCKDYKEYQDWVKHRNPERFRINIEHGKNYDSKNLSHAVRLLHTGIEIAKTGQYIVDRTNIDRDLLLRIKRGEMDYNELMEYVEGQRQEMEDAMKKSTLKEDVDLEAVNKLILNIRKKQCEEWIKSEK